MCGVGRSSPRRRLAQSAADAARQRVLILRQPREVTSINGSGRPTALQNLFGWITVTRDNDVMSPRISAVGLTLLLAPSLSAQSDAQLRPYVDALLAKVSGQRLPRGDTLVAFAKQGPMLFFVVGGRPDDVTSRAMRALQSIGVLPRSCVARDRAPV